MRFPFSQDHRYQKNFQSDESKLVIKKSNCPFLVLFRKILKRGGRKKSLIRAIRYLSKTKKKKKISNIEINMKSITAIRPSRTSSTLFSASKQQRNNHSKLFSSLLKSKIQQQKFINTTSNKLFVPISSSSSSTINTSSSRQGKLLQKNNQQRPFSTTRQARIFDSKSEIYTQHSKKWFSTPEMDASQMTGGEEIKAAASKAGEDASAEPRLTSKIGQVYSRKLTEEVPEARHLGSEAETEKQTKRFWLEVVLVNAPVPIIILALGFLVDYFFLRT